MYDDARGAKPGTQTMTYALKGEFEKDKNLAQMFMQMIAG